MDRVWPEQVHRRAGIERELASRVGQGVLRFFLYVELVMQKNIFFAPCFFKSFIFIIIIIIIIFLI